jgi:branched-chain amino acid transport system ATP-binding protein
MRGQVVTDSNGKLLTVNSLSQRFGGVVAFEQVDLDVVAGEIHGVIGPNGAGKTTLFDCIADVRRAAEGTIYLDGRDITTM